MYHTVETLKRQKLTFFILVIIVIVSAWPAARNEYQGRPHYEEATTK